MVLDLNCQQLDLRSLGYRLILSLHQFRAMKLRIDVVTIASRTSEKPIKDRRKSRSNSVCGNGVALWRAGGKDRFDSRHCMEIQRAAPGKCHEAADTSGYAYQMRETGRQGIHNSKESLAQPRVVGQPHNHARQDAIVKEKRPACALKLPEPGIILTYAVGNVPVQQFGSHQCLSHAAAGNGIEEPRGVAKQHKPRGHATAGLGSQRRGCEQWSRLFGPFQTFGKFWFRKQPTAEGALDGFSELLRICQHGDEHFTPGQRGYVQLVTRSEEHIDKRRLGMSLRQPEMRANPESLPANRNV